MADYPEMPTAPNKETAPAEDEEFDFMAGEEEAPEGEEAAPADLSTASDDDLIEEILKRGLADEIEEEAEEKGEAAEEVAEESEEEEAPGKTYSDEGSSFSNPFDLAKK